MRQNLKLKGRLQNYLSWPLILMIPFIIINIPVYLENVEAGGLISAFLVVYFVCVFVAYQRTKPVLIDEVSG